MKYLMILALISAPCITFAKSIVVCSDPSFDTAETRANSLNKKIEEASVKGYTDASIPVSIFNSICVTISEPKN